MHCYVTCFQLCERNDASTVRAVDHRGISFWSATTCTAAGLSFHLLPYFYNFSSTCLFKCEVLNEYYWVTHSRTISGSTGDFFLLCCWGTQKPLLKLPPASIVCVVFLSSLASFAWCVFLSSANKCSSNRFTKVEFRSRKPRRCNGVFSYRSLARDSSSWMVKELQTHRGVGNLYGGRLMIPSTSGSCGRSMIRTISHCILQLRE